MTCAPGTGLFLGEHYRHSNSILCVLKSKRRCTPLVLLNTLTWRMYQSRYSKRLGEAKLGSVKDGWNIFRKLLVRRIFATPHEGRLGEGNLIDSMKRQASKHSVESPNYAPKTNCCTRRIRLGRPTDATDDSATIPGLS